MIKKNNFISWKFLVGLILSISCLIFALKDFRLSEFIYMLKNIDLLYLILATILLLFSVSLRSLRWKFIISKNEVLVKDLFVAQFIGYFGNNVLPFRLGELLRSRYIAQKYSSSTSEVFGSVILERTFDLLGIIFLAIILLFSNRSILLEFEYTFFIIPIAFFVILIILYSFFFKTKNYNGSNKIILILIDIFKGIKSLNKNNFFFIILYTFSIWIIYIFHVYLVQKSILLNLSISECIFLLFVSSIVLSIPSLPANIGTFELGVKETLLMLNVLSYSSSFPFLLHSATFIPYTVIGGIMFMYYNYQVFRSK